MVRNSNSDILLLLLLPLLRKQSPVYEHMQTAIIPVDDLLPIAHPLAQKKLAKKLHKTVKKGLLAIVWILDYNNDSS